jgi:hypothetical protein
MISPKPSSRCQSQDGFLLGHAARRRVMEKAGMRLHGQRDGEPAELVVYEALAGLIG